MTHTPAPSIAVIASPAKPSRRTVLRAWWVWTGWFGSVYSLNACGGGSTSSAAPASPVPAPVPTPPPAPGPVAPAPAAPAAATLGGQQLAYSRDGVAMSPLSVGPMATRASGSTVLVCIGRGVVSTHAAPTDNKDNAFVQLASTHTYSLWPNSGTALYACERAVGGSDHVVTAAKAVPADETTLSVVEVVNGGVVGDVKWNEVLSGNPLTSLTVTTTGPALLVAWWWGDANVRSNKTAVPDNGFSVIHSILLEGALVQCAVAVRQVGAAGSYRVTWAATPLQGAQLWIAAVHTSA